MKPERHCVKVTFDDGNSLTTEINGTKEEIRRYYINNVFNLGVEGDDMRIAVVVEFLEKAGV